MSKMEKKETLISNKPHIMFISLPLQGHMNPMVQFSKRLVSKGIKVTTVATTTQEISSHAKSTSINIEHISVDKPSSQGNTSDIIDEYLALLKISITRSLPEVIEKQKTNGCPVKILVYDALMPYALDISHKLGIQGVAFCTHSSAVFAIYYHVNQGTLDINSLEELSPVKLPSLPLLGIKDLPSLVYDMGTYKGLLTLCKNDQFLGMEKADCVLFNTFEKLECEVVDWLSSKWKIMTIGPSVPSMFLDKRLADDRDYGLSLFKPDGEACIKWLDGKDTDSVVYVSFGSLANLTQDYMDEIALGLLNSKCSFLWVVIDTEKSKLSENFIEESADRGLIVNWCPQLEVLAHRAVGSFMTHCGWNSTLEALCLGVPMMVVPQWTDQTTNAKYIVDVWQTGVRVKAHDKESITREDITKCVKDVMEGTKREELRANALKLKELALEAMSEGGSSDKNIDDFISKIVTPTTST